jgi:hypothetical protein
MNERIEDLDDGTAQLIEHAIEHREHVVITRGPDSVAVIVPYEWYATAMR